MLVNVIKVEARGAHRLWLEFDDGARGEVELAGFLTFAGVFEPLRDPAYFGQARVDPDLGTVVWPNGADVDPVVLHALVTGRPIPDLSIPAPGR